PLTNLDNLAVYKTCQTLAEIAFDRYFEAEEIMSSCKSKVVRPAFIMMAIYRRLLEKVVKRGWQNNKERMSLSRFEKLSIVTQSTLYK
ncbi:MAG: hypothetical protein VX617_00650, partial [Pseudomonadota bacterium]|nr:hypothetical protein [Pseudomonadota bacterium]